jgi:hypothetical protein
MDKSNLGAVGKRRGGGRMDQTFCGWLKTGARRFGRRQKKTVSKGWVQAYSVANYYCCQSLHKLPAHKAQGMFGTAFLAATVKTIQRVTQNTHVVRWFFSNSESHAKHSRGAMVFSQRRYRNCRSELEPMFFAPLHEGHNMHTAPRGSQATRPRVCLGPCR